MNPKILVVDDDPRYGNLISQVAALRQIEAVYCSNSSEACDFLEKEPSIGLIFLDVSMPEPDGFELLEQFARRSFSGHVVMMSGFDASILYASNRIAVDFGIKVLSSLEKPFSIREVDAILAVFQDQPSK